MIVLELIREICFRFASEMAAVGVAPESSAAEKVGSRAISTDIVAVAMAAVVAKNVAPDAGEFVAVGSVAGETVAR